MGQQRGGQQYPGIALAELCMYFFQDHYHMWVYVKGFLMFVTSM